ARNEGLIFNTSASFSTVSMRGTWPVVMSCTAECDIPALKPSAPCPARPALWFARECLSRSRRCVMCNAAWNGVTIEELAALEKGEAFVAAATALRQRPHQQVQELPPLVELAHPQVLRRA